MIKDDIRIIFLTEIDWEYPVISRSRHLAKAFAKNGIEVIWLNRPSWISIAFRVRRFFSTSRKFSLKNPKISFLWFHLPLSLGKIFLWLNIIPARQFFQRKIKSILKNKRKKTILIISSPIWWPVIKNSLSCFDIIYYDIIDDISIFAPPKLLRKFKEWHEELIKHSKRIFIVAETLRKEIKNSSCPIHYLPNGVDIELFSPNKHFDIPNDLKNIKPPIVGFSGMIAGWLDYGLLQKIISSLPEINFVFIGPVFYKRGIQKLKPFKNTYWLGWKPQNQIPIYLSFFDVLILPFKLDQVGNSASPLKLYEYLAMQKPVISTPIPEAKSMESWVYIAKDSNGFISLIRKILKGNEPKGLKEKRREFAKRNTWDSRAKEILEFIQQDLSL